MNCECEKLNPGVCLTVVAWALVGNPYCALPTDLKVLCRSCIEEVNDSFLREKAKVSHLTEKWYEKN